jgi:hypothetical protein
LPCLRHLHACQAKFCSQCGSPRAAPLGSVPLRRPSPHAPNAATRWLLVGAALVAAAGWLAFKPGMLPTGGNTDSPAADAPTDASKAATLVGPQAAGTVATPDQPMAAAVTAAPGTPPASSGAAVPTTPASTAPATPAPAVAANPPPAARPAATAPVVAATPAPAAAVKAVPAPAVSLPFTISFTRCATPGAQRHAHTE